MVLTFGRCAAYASDQLFSEQAQARVAALRAPAGATPAATETRMGGMGCGCDEARTGNRGTCPVGSYGSNAAGLSDMVGNLWEWVVDCDEGDCSRRMVRGGSWIIRAASRRPGARGRPHADARGANIGFRVSRTLD